MKKFLLRAVESITERGGEVTMEQYEVAFDGDAIPKYIAVFRSDDDDLTAAQLTALKQTARERLGIQGGEMLLLAMTKDTEFDLFEVAGQMESE